MISDTVGLSDGAGDAILSKNNWSKSTSAITKILIGLAIWPLQGFDPEIKVYPVVGNSMAAEEDCAGRYGSHNDWHFHWVTSEKRPILLLFSQGRAGQGGIGTIPVKKKCWTSHHYNWRHACFCRMRSEYKESGNVLKLWLPVPSLTQVLFLDRVFSIGSKVHLVDFKNWCLSAGLDLDQTPWETTRLTFNMLSHLWLQFNCCGLWHPPQGHHILHSSGPSSSVPVCSMECTGNSAQ